MPSIELNEATLLAYVDGNLSKERAEAVEAALAHDPEAQAIVDELRQCSPETVRKAFDLKFAQAPPSDLAQTIRQRHASLGRSSRRFGVIGLLAVSIVFFCLGFGGGFLSGSAYRRHDTSPATLELWVADMARYQKLYTRDTVLSQSTSARDTRAFEANLTEHLGLAWPVPDLSSLGLTFKLGQMLATDDGRSIVQLIYLPEEGPPIAICVTPSDEADHDLASGDAEGLNFVHWTSKSYSFAIMGKAPTPYLSEIASSVAAGLGQGKLWHGRSGGVTVSAASSRRIWVFAKHGTSWTR